MQSSRLGLLLCAAVFVVLTNALTVLFLYVLHPVASARGSASHGPSIIARKVVPMPAAGTTAVPATVPATVSSLGSSSGSSSGAGEKAVQATSLPATSRVLVTSVPAGAEVRAGLEVQGTTPLVIEVAKGKSRSLALKKPGYREQKIRVSGKRKKVRIELTELKSGGGSALGSKNSRLKRDKLAVDKSGKRRGERAGERPGKKSRADSAASTDKVAGARKGKGQRGQVRDAAGEAQAERRRGERPRRAGVTRGAGGQGLVKAPSEPRAAVKSDNPDPWDDGSKKSKAISDLPRPWEE